MYYFVTNVYSWSKLGGPQTRARNIEIMLHRWADFEFEIVTTDFERFFKRASQKDFVHIQGNNQLLSMGIEKNLQLIIGPNFQWHRLPEKALQYDKMQWVLTHRSDPAARSYDSIWKDRIRCFPAFADEQYWIPGDQKKTIDVLTISKAFNYPPYCKNLASLIRGIKSTGLSHTHLSSFTSVQYRDHLQRAKVLAYPSPKEAGASLANALIEASMVDVPIIGLSSVLKNEFGEWHPSRGKAVDSIDEMVKQLPAFVSAHETHKPREWMKDHHGSLAGYKRLCKLLRESP